jgi:hypothetical protein
MNGIDWQNLIQLGPLAVVLLFVMYRLEGAMKDISCMMDRTNKILILLLRKSGVSDEEALGLIERDADVWYLPGGTEAKR